MLMLELEPDLSQMWIQHQRKRSKTTQSWACVYCLDREIFTTADHLWVHAGDAHQEKLPRDDTEVENLRRKFEAESFTKR